MYKVFKLWFLLCHPVMSSLCKNFYYITFHKVFRIHNSPYKACKDKILNHFLTQNDDSYCTSSIPTVIRNFQLIRMTHHLTLHHHILTLTNIHSGKYWKQMFSFILFCHYSDIDEWIFTIFSHDLLLNLAVHLLYHF